MPLIVEPNFHAPDKRTFRAFSAADDFYEMLIEAHRDLSDEASAALNAKLILLLANHVGDLGILREAFARAREA